jgi:hypothetical protein
MRTPVTSALVSMLLTATVGLGACSDGGETVEHPGGGDPNPPHKLSNGKFSITSVPAEHIQPCGRAGGLLVDDVRCANARRLVIPLGDPFSRYGSLAERNRQVISQQGEGWTCWSELATDYGPIHNVCWRGEQTMIWDEG